MKVSKTFIHRIRDRTFFFFKDRNDLTVIYGEKRYPREEKMGIKGGGKFDIIVF